MQIRFGAAIVCNLTPYKQVDGLLRSNAKIAQALADAEDDVVLYIRQNGSHHPDELHLDVESSGIFNDTPISYHARATSLYVRNGKIELPENKIPFICQRLADMSGLRKVLAAFRQVQKIGDVHSRMKN